MVRPFLPAGTVIAASIEEGAAEAAGKDYRLFLLILLMTAALVVIIPILVYRDKRESRAWGVRKAKRGRLRDWIYTPLYRFLIMYPLTRAYMEKLAYRYRLISPGNSKVIARRTVNDCLISWGICILTFLLVYMNNPRMSTLITVTAAILIIHAEVIGRMAKLYEIKVLSETQRLISNVQHNFFVEYRVDDAIYRSRDALSPNMKAAADQIYQLLLAEDKEEALREYYENIPNKYLRSFLGLCAGVMEKGDQVVKGKRLFIANLEKLYQEIEIEIEKIQRLNIEFLGVIAVVTVPIFCIDFVKSFAVNIKENMVSFYYGKEGYLLDLGLILVISMIYVIMRKSAEYRSFHLTGHRMLYRIDRIPFIRKCIDNYCEKNASRVERLRHDLRNYGSNIRPRHFILRSFLLAGLAFIISAGMFIYLHKVGREQLLIADRADVEMLTSAAGENHYERMGEIIEEYTARYVLPGDDGSAEEMPMTVEELSRLLSEDGALYNNIINNALSGEIYRRVHRYKNETFSLYNISLCMAISILAYFLPKVVLRYSMVVTRDAMEDEVNQFNSIICMLMYIDSMTVKQILREMESFAVVFKESLRICINDYGAGDMTALTELKDREPYEPFKRIIDNLIRCDEMPISQAFHEIDVERDGYMSKRKLANEKSIRKRVIRAYLLAAVPFVMLFAYGIVPPLAASMSEINTLLGELEGTAW